MIPKKLQKVTAILMACAMLLTACAHSGNGSGSSLDEHEAPLSQPEPSSAASSSRPEEPSQAESSLSSDEAMVSAPTVAEAPVPRDEDGYYIADEWRWNSSGKSVTYRLGNQLVELDLQNQVRSVAALDSPILKQDSDQLATVVWDDSMVAVLGAGSSPAMLYLDQSGQAHLCNLEIFRADGTLVRALPPHKVYDEQGNFLAPANLKPGTDAQPSWRVIGSARWIGEEKLALDLRNQVWIYDTAADELVLADDMAPEIGVGKEFAYLGTNWSFPSDDGTYYYFAHKNKEQSNLTGSLWAADSTGSHALFDGKLFTFAEYRDGALAATIIDQTAGGNQSQIWYTGPDGALRSLPMTYACSLPLFLQDGLISFETSYTEEGSGRQAVQFYAVDTATAQVVSCTPAAPEGSPSTSLCGAFRRDGVTYYLALFGNRLGLVNGSTERTTLLDAESSSLAELNGDATHAVCNLVDDNGRTAIKIVALNV